MAAVAALELDVAAARVAAGVERHARSAVPTRRALALVGRLAVRTTVAVDTVATVRSTLADQRRRNST